MAKKQRKDKKPKNNIKYYYSIQEAIRMLPYIKSYCNDLKEVYKKIENLIARREKFSNLISLSPEINEKIKKIRQKINERIDFEVTQYFRWKQELTDMNLCICSGTLGRIDIPIYDDPTESLLMICVEPKITAATLEWHMIDESHENAHPYWWKNYKTEKETCI
jgi:hypothetical protein